MRKGQRKNRKTKLPTVTPLIFPGVIGEESPLVLAYPESRIRTFARRNRRRMTKAEIRLLVFLGTVGARVLGGPFRTQHVISGKWIVDFFFPEIRLAIEV